MSVRGEKRPNHPVSLWLKVFPSKHFSHRQIELPNANRSEGWGATATSVGLLRRSSTNVVECRLILVPQFKGSVAMTVESKEAALCGPGGSTMLKYLVGEATESRHKSPFLPSNLQPGITSHGFATVAPTPSKSRGRFSMPIACCLLGLFLVVHPLAAPKLPGLFQDTSPIQPELSFPMPPSL